MRLLQTMGGAKHGGAETFFVRLAGALQRRGVDQRVVVRGVKARERELARLGVDTVVAPFGGLLDLKTKGVLRREIADFRPDVVLSWMSRATSLTPPGDYCFAARLGGYYNLKYYQGCDHLICNTEHIVEYVCKGGWPAARAHYVPNFTAFEPAEPAAREALETPADARVVLAAGRLHPHKAFDVLIGALTAVPNTVLWLAGAGPLDRVLRKMARDLGVDDRVRFLGWRDDVDRLMAACDVVACPSRVEPLGNVVLEAWASGRPVVAARATGPRALIDHGVSGLLSDIDAVGELAGNIRRVLDDPALAKELGARGRAAYERDFTEDVVVDRYLELFGHMKAACAA